MPYPGGDPTFDEEPITQEEINDALRAFEADGVMEVDWSGPAPMARLTPKGRLMALREEQQSKPLTS